MTASVQLLGTTWEFILILYFSSWVEGLLVLGCCPSPYVTSWILHVPHAFKGSAKQTLFPFVGCSQGFRLKGLWSKPFLLSIQGFLNGCLLWNLRRIESNCQHLRKSNHFTWSTSVPKMCSATRISCCPHADKVLRNFLAPRQRLSRSPLNVITNIPYKSLLFVHRRRIFVETANDIFFMSTNINCKIKKEASSFYSIISNVVSPSSLFVLHLFPSVLFWSALRQKQ